MSTNYQSNRMYVCLFIKFESLGHFSSNLDILLKHKKVLPLNGVCLYNIRTGSNFIIFLKGISFYETNLVYCMIYLEEEFPAPPPPEDLAKLSFEAQFKVLKYLV